MSIWFPSQGEGGTGVDFAFSEIGERTPEDNPALPVNRLVFLQSKEDGRGAGVSLSPMSMMEGGRKNCGLSADGFTCS